MELAILGTNNGRCYDVELVKEGDSLGNVNFWGVNRTNRVVVKAIGVNAPKDFQRVSLIHYEFPETLESHLTNKFKEAGINDMNDIERAIEVFKFVRSKVWESWDTSSSHDFDPDISSSDSNGGMFFGF